MAEDLHNPLNNPAADPVGQDPTPREEPPERDSELEDFLDDVLEHPDPYDEPVRAEAAPESPPTERSSPLAPAAESTPSATEAESVQPDEPAGDTGPTQDELQRQVLQRLNDQLDRMGQTPEPEPTPAPTVTPAEMLKQLAPRIQEYVDAGWINEDFAALYPEQAALQVHMYDRLQQGGQELEQTRQFTQAEQTRQSVEAAERTLSTAMDEVAGRGDMFSGLSDAEVRGGFREFLIQLNPHLSQITPDFLENQFVAYNRNAIFELLKQNAGGNEEQNAPSAAQQAQQEGGSSRGTPRANEPPEFAEMLQGTAAARWFE